MTRAPALALLLTAAGAAAEPLSRAEAVAAALAANPAVKKSEEELVRVRGYVMEARADALPDLTVSGSANRYKDPSFLNSSSFDAFPAELRGSLRPIGTNLYETSGQLRQTLFSFKLGRAIRAARLGATYGEEGIRQARQDVALLAVRAYDAYLLAREAVVVARKAVVQKQAHLDMARNRHAAGVATELDVLRSEVDLQNQKTVLLRYEGEADQARSALNAVMVRPIDAPIDPTDTLAYEPVDTTLEQALERAALRPEVRSAALAEQVREQLVGVAEAEGRPSLEFVGDWGFSVRETTNFFARDYAKWSAAVALRLPVFDGFRTAGKVAQAKAEQAKAAQDRVAVENRIRLEAKAAVDRLRVARAVLEASQMNVAQATRAVEMTQANYNHGAATTVDVIDAQAALTLAESTRIQALHEHADARATLRYVMALDPLTGKEAEGTPR